MDGRVTRESVAPGAADGEWHLTQLITPAELAECEQIQRVVWGFSDFEMLPAIHMRAITIGGGLVAGARLDGRLVGFALGFPAHRPDVSDAVGFHSDMAAVLPELRSRGVGRSLKRFQRRWCLERGFGWMQWTYDPLRAANARFNLEYLGARSREYLENAYGPVENALNAGLPSDRLVAHWDLGSGEVESLAQGDTRPEPRGSPTLALRRLPDGTAGEVQHGLQAESIRIETPGKLSEMQVDRPAEVERWRLALRGALVHYLERGYEVSRFVDGGYLLVPIRGRAAKRRRRRMKQG